MNTIHTLQQNIPPDVKVTVRCFQMQNGVLMTDTTSEIEVDDEVNTSFLFIIITVVLQVLNQVKCVSLFILEHSDCNK